MEIRRIVSRNFTIDTTAPPAFSHDQLLNDRQSISNLGYTYPSSGPQLARPRTYAQERILRNRKSARAVKKAEAAKKSNTFLVVLPGTF